MGKLETESPMDDGEFPVEVTDIRPLKPKWIFVLDNRYTGYYTTIRATDIHEAKDLFAECLAQYAMVCSENHVSDYASLLFVEFNSLK